MKFCIKTEWKRGAFGNSRNILAKEVGRGVPVLAVADDTAAYGAIATTPSEGQDLHLGLREHVISSKKFNGNINPGDIPTPGDAIAELPDGPKNYGAAQGQ